MRNKLVVACSVGNCVHVAGGIHFLDLAANEGYDTLFLGPAVAVADLLRQIDALQPEMVAVGYRLTPENVEPILDALIEGAASLHCRPRWVFGGTRPVAERAAARGFFEKVFSGTRTSMRASPFCGGRTSQGTAAPPRTG